MHQEERNLIKELFRIASGPETPEAMTEFKRVGDKFEEKFCKDINHQEVFDMIFNCKSIK
jgi:hypothetical protein